MKTSHVVAAFVVVAGLAGVMLLGRGQRAAPHEGQDPASPASSPTVTLPTPARAGCRLTAGSGATWSYASHSQVAFAANVLRFAVAEAPPSETDFTATLTIEALTSDAEGSTVLARFDDVNQPAVAVVGEAVTTPFLFSLSPTCEITRVARHLSTPRGAARTQQAALSDLWFSTDPNTGKTHSFPNSLGRAMGRMNRLDDGSWERSIVGYSERWSAQLADTQLVHASATVTLGDTGWFERLQGVHELRGGPISSARTEVVVARADHSPGVLSNASRKLEDYVWENALPFNGDASAALATGSSASDLQHAQLVTQMKELSFDAAMVRLQARLSAKENISTQWPETAAFLDAHPESIGDYVAVITDEQFPPAWKAASFVALGQARNPQARQALFDVFSDRAENPMDRVRSSLALVTRRDVGASLASALESEANRAPDDDDEAMVSRQAVLHLGILAATHQSEPEILMSARHVVEQRLSSAREPGDYSLVFHAMGNLGDLSMLPEIERWSRVPDVDIREHVPKAMGRLKPDAVHAFTLEWLRRETSPEVKRELFHVIYQQYTDASRPITDELKVEALAHLEQQPGVLTRQSLLRLLGPLVEANPDVRRAFVRQMKPEFDSRSGLYSLVVNYLSPEDVLQGMAAIDGLREQFVPGSRPQVDGEPGNDSIAPQRGVNP